jgi:hypothetical protein
LACLDLLGRLGAVGFNYTVERRTRFESQEWVGGPKLARILGERHFAIVVGPGGDIYARFIQARTPALRGEGGLTEFARVWLIISCYSAASSLRMLSFPGRLQTSKSELSEPR